MAAAAMDGEALRECCLQMPGAVETFPFGPETSVFKAGGQKGKIFAISTLDGDPLTVSLKAEPELVTSLRASYESVGPGYHLNKKHWITVGVGGDLDDDRLRDLIEDSYDLVRPR